MSEVQTYNGPAPLVNPFERASDMPAHVNAGTVMIEESRAIAEVKGKIAMARMFPRNKAQAYQDVMDACSRRKFAELATYAFPRAGKTVSGPSIRLAEMIAAAWGNIDYGTRELSRKEGVSEMEAFAWDMQTNTIASQRFTVNHIRDKTEGGAKVSSERDVYELTANNASRRLRERIFAIVPDDLVQEALAKCRETLAGASSAPIADRVRGMISKFNKHGVTAQMIEKRLGRPLDQILPDDIAEYVGIYNSIEDGMSAPGDWFGGDTPALGAPGAQQPAAGANDSQGQQQESKPAARRGRKTNGEQQHHEQQQAQGQQEQDAAQKQADTANNQEDAQPQQQEAAPTLAQPATQPQPETTQAAPAASAADVF